jgi:putative membrane protein
MVKEKETIPKWAMKVLNPAQIQSIESSIERVEKQSSIELVPMLVKRSSTIDHVVIILFLLLLVIFQLIDFSRYVLWLDWGFGLPLVFLFSILSIPLSLFLSRFEFIQRCFVSFQDRCHQVECRAEIEFYNAGLHHAPKSNGVLLMFSKMEKRVVILADENITRELPDDYWLETIKSILDYRKSHGLSATIEYAIKAVSDKLTDKFPKDQAVSSNDLSNRLIISD